jgi:prephenate dehydrogenase
VAYALAKALGDRSLGGVSYGSGARDTTRLAGSSPEMWLDILLHNGAPLVEAISSVEGGMAELRRLIETGDRQGLERYLEAAREFRRGLDR